MPLLVPSPLAEADPHSISELFNTDPLELTDANVFKIVSELRKDRGKFQIEERNKRATGGKKIDAPKNLQLEDLFPQGVKL